MTGEMLKLKKVKQACNWFCSLSSNKRILDPLIFIVLQMLYQIAFEENLKILSNVHQLRSLLSRLVGSKVGLNLKLPLRQLVFEDDCVIATVWKVNTSSLISRLAPQYAIPSSLHMRWALFWFKTRDRERLIENNSRLSWRWIWVADCILPWL